MPEASGTIFELPGGLVLEDDQRLTHVELRPLIGREEEWLAEHRALPNARLATRILSGCLLDTNLGAPVQDLPRRLLVGDRDYLILQLRRLTLGDRVQAVIECPACRQKVDVDFRVSDVPVERRPQRHPSYELEAGEGRRIRFRLPDGADQEAVAGLPLADAAAALFERCLAGGQSSALSPDEQAQVIGAMERVVPQVDLELDLTCPECGHTWTAPFDTTAFFFDEMRLNLGQLLREVHLLAFYYHWSESDILGLVRSRRRAYLGLLSDSLRRD